MNVIIYARFSDRPNADRCESIDAQLEACTTWARSRRARVVGTFTDPARSGADEDRPGLWAAVEAVTKGTVLLVWKLDRLARNVYLAELLRREVEKRGGTIASVMEGDSADDPESRLIRQILAAFAEYERRVIGIRTKHGMLRAQSKGRAVSAIPPYGFTRDDSGGLLPVPAEQAAIERARELASLNRGLREIARTLDAEGYPCRGANWSHKTVKAMLDRT